MNRFEDLSLWRQGDQRAPHKALLDWRPEPKHMEWHGREVFKGAA